MRPTEIAISNYRSIRRLSIPVHPLSALSADGSDLAAPPATLYTIREDANDLQDAIEDVFPGAELRAWE